MGSARPGRVTSLLADYDYPGNIRELKNVVERALKKTNGYIEYHAVIADKTRSAVLGFNIN